MVICWITASGSTSTLSNSSDPESIALFSIPCGDAVTYNRLLFSHHHLRMTFAASPACKLCDAVDAFCCERWRKPNSGGVKHPPSSFLLSVILQVRHLESSFDFQNSPMTQRTNQALIICCNQAIVETGRWFVKLLKSSVQQVISSNKSGTM